MIGDWWLVIGDWGLQMRSGIILDNEVFYFGQFIGDTLIVVLMLVKEPFVLVRNMRTDLLHKFIIAS